MRRGSDSRHPHMISTVIYDADQTVLNSPRYNFSNTFTQEMGIANDAMEPFFKGAFKLCTIGKADVKETLKPFLKGWNWKGSADELLAYWFAAENNIDEHIIQHVRELRAKGVRCFLATDNERRRTDYLWNTLGLASEFDGIFSSSSTGFTKQESGAWIHIWETLAKPEKESVLFWDDAVENVAAARAFGFLAEQYINFNTYATVMAKLLT